MTNTRRDFLRLSGIGGVVFASGLAGCASRAGGRAPATGARGGAPGPARDFFFLQLSDTHWGYKGDANPMADTTLKTTVATINAVAEKPAFIMFTGDLTHTTDDGAERRRRMAEMKSIVSELGAPLRFIPGEHDASLDRGAAYREHFGDTHYTFDHEGVHFIALDNVSDPDSILGAEQLAWLGQDLAKVDRDTPIVVFAHRPLFDLYPEWDWHTRDGAEAVKQLSAFPHVTVFYGHIHQENHHMTGQIAHHSAHSLIFPLPAPGSVPKKAPVPWDPAHPGQGLGWRRIGAHPAGFEYAIEERALSADAKTGEKVVRVTASKFAFAPSTIELTRGVPVVLELTSLDRRHGFLAPGLALRADVQPGRTTRLRFTPRAAGTYRFHCDVFCGDGHEQMEGAIVVS